MFPDYRIHAVLAKTFSKCLKSTTSVSPTDVTVQKKIFGSGMHSSNLANWTTMKERNEMERKKWKIL